MLISNPLFAVLIFIVGLISIDVARRVATRYSILDSPSHRKMQIMPVPYLGGIGIMFAFSMFLILGYMLDLETSKNIANKSWQIIGLISLLLCVAGLIDDAVSMHYRIKLIIQAVISVSAAATLSLSSFAAKSFGSAILNFVITFLWIMLIVNAINFFDNMDGLSSGTLFLSAITYSKISYDANQLFIANVCSGLALILLSFLIFNFPKARIYMGDAGSLTLGFVFAVLALSIDLPSVNLLDSGFRIILPLSLPLFDALLVVSFRLLRRIHPASPGKDHLSHRIMKLGLNKTQAVLCIWTVHTFCCVASLLTNLPSKFLATNLGLQALILLIIYIESERKN